MLKTKTTKNIFKIKHFTLYTCENNNSNSDND